MDSGLRRREPVHRGNDGARDCARSSNARSVIEFAGPPCAPAPWFTFHAAARALEQRYTGIGHTEGTLSRDALTALRTLVTVRPSATPLQQARCSSITSSVGRNTRSPRARSRASLTARRASSAASRRRAFTASTSSCSRAGGARPASAHWPAVRRPSGAGAPPDRQWLGALPRSPERVIFIGDIEEARAYAPSLPLVRELLVHGLHALRRQRAVLLQQHELHVSTTRSAWCSALERSALLLFPGVYAPRAAASSRRRASSSADLVSTARRPALLLNGICLRRQTERLRSAIVEAIEQSMCRPLGIRLIAIGTSTAAGAAAAGLRSA